MTPLRRRMTEDMQVRSLSPQTQATYVQQVSLFARHFNRSPELLGPEEIRSYQVYLTNERKLAPSSISIAISALRFFYRITLHKDWSLTEVIPTPKKPQKLPIVPSPEEVLQFLGCVWNIKHRTILTICYAAGLRVSEAACLKVRDIDSKRMVIRVEQGKGRIDRYVMLSPKLLQILRDWWRVDRPRRWLFPGDQVDNHIGRSTHWERTAKPITRPFKVEELCKAFVLYREGKGLDKATLSEDRYISRRLQKHLGGYMAHELGVAEIRSFLDTAKTSDHLSTNFTKSAH